MSAILSHSLRTISSEFEGYKSYKENYDVLMTLPIVRELMDKNTQLMQENKKLLEIIYSLSMGSGPVMKKEEECNKSYSSNNIEIIRNEKPNIVYDLVEDDDDVSSIGNISDIYAKNVDIQGAVEKQDTVEQQGETEQQGKTEQQDAAEQQEQDEVVETEADAEEEVEVEKQGETEKPEEQGDADTVEANAEEEVEVEEEAEEEVVEEEQGEADEEEVVEEQGEAEEEEVVEEQCEADEEEEEEVDEQGEAEEEVEVEEEEQGEDEEAEEEEEDVKEVLINGKIYYTTDEQNGTIYDLDDNGDISLEVGIFVNGKARFH